MMPIQFGLQLDGTLRTSHSGYAQSELRCTFLIANSKYESFDHRMRSKSMDIHDGKMLYAHNLNDRAM